MKIKKRTFLRVLFSLCFILLFIGIGKGIHSLTGGFCLQKILADFSDRTPSEELSKEEFNELDRILSQNFIYSSKGRQAYVFESEDGQYVLKFIRYHLLHPPFWIHLLRFPKSLDDYRKKEIQSKRDQLVNVMKSYRLAYDALREETQVLFVHLNKTHTLNKQITLIDRVGRKYQVDLDSMGFLLQKKALLLKDVLKQLRRKKDEEGIRDVYRAYLNVIFSRRSKGIINKDQCWYKNYGMIQGKACEIDMGRFAREEEECNPDLLRIKIHHNILPLRTWIEKNFPTLLSDFDAYFDQNLADFNHETLSLLAVLLLGLILSKSWHHWTDGFKMHKVQPYFISSHQTDVIPEEIFHQSFHYLAKGRQAYVFESKDGKMVLKLLRTHSFSPPFWSRLPISFSLLKKKREKTKNKRDFWLDSFSLASDELKEETMILYSHLGQTQDLTLPLVLYDKLGRKITIDPNRYLFQIQMKVTLLEDALMSADDPTPIIQSFLHVIAKRMKKGIVNESRSYFKNLGFFNGKVVEFDVGEFIQKASVPPEEFVRFSRPFRQWLSERRPSSVPVFDEEFTKALTSYSIGT